MNKKNNVVKKEGYKRSFRTNEYVACPNNTNDKDTFCENKVSKEKIEKKRLGCASNEDTVKNICYQRCKPGFIGKGINCIKMKSKNAYKEGLKKKQLELAIRDASKRDKFSNTKSEWDFNEIDKNLSDLFDGNLKNYRWAFVIGLGILIIIIIVNLFDSTETPKLPQQPSIILQIPSTGMSVPQQFLQPALQVTSPVSSMPQQPALQVTSPVSSAPQQPALQVTSPVSSAPQQIIKIPELQMPTPKSNIPIMITDLKKTGGFNKSIFNEIETSIFSDWSTSD